MYMTGLFGQNVIYNIIAFFTSYYLQNILFIPMGIVGVILVAAQVWDAFNDPIMGTIVDKTRTKIGKCRPWLLAVPVINGVITMVCFLSPQYDVDASAAKKALVICFAAFFYIAWGMTYTAGDIPLWGISALMTEDEKDRQKLQAAARIAAGIGAGIAVLGFQPLALAFGQGLLAKRAAAFGITDLNDFAAQAKAAGISVKALAEQHGWMDYTEAAVQTDRMGCIIIALILTVIGVATFQLAGIFCKERIKPSEKNNSVGENFKMMWRNKPFRQLLLSGIVSAPRNMTMLVAVSMVTYYFSTADPGLATMYLALLGGGLFIGMFGATALVPRLLDRFTKKRLYNLSNLVEIAPNVALFVFYLISLNLEGGLTNIVLLIPTIVMFFLKGICLGIFNTLQTAMIASCVDYEDYTNNVRPDAVFFSGQTFMVKIGTGISNILYSLLCAHYAFEGRNVETLKDMIAEHKVPRELMEKGSEALVHTMNKFAADGSLITGTLTAGQLFNFFTLMFFAVSILPAIGNVLAVLPTWNWALDDAEYASILEKLQARRREIPCNSD
jgi:Na+/melibiose symporter-like transporter